MRIYLHNAMGMGVYGSVPISVIRVHAPKLFALRGGGGVSNQFPENVLCKHLNGRL